MRSRTRLARSRRRRGPASAPLGAVALWLVACSSPAPEATKLDDPKHNQYGRAQKPPRPENPVLKSAELDTPQGTVGSALPKAEVDAIVARFEAERDQSATVQSAATLLECANREPTTVRCDGELAMLLLPIEKRRASALYYAKRAAVQDDPDASAELYARLAEAIRPHGLYEEAAQAYAYAIARDDKAEYHARRSAMLQSKRGGNEIEAADELAKAYAMDPKWDYLRDEAILRARVPDHWERARELFLEVAETAATPELKEKFEARAAQLEGMIKERPKPGTPPDTPAP